MLPDIPYTYRENKLGLSEKKHTTATLAFEPSRKGRNLSSA